MTTADISEENEVIDTLCFSIQRQSALCLDFVMHAVAMEREQCAQIAEAAAQFEDDESAASAAMRIAERIRARTAKIPAATAVTRQANG